VWKIDTIMLSFTRLVDRSDLYFSPSD
jgi:hypothetical protein